jgi:hypothetical protein
MIFFLFTEFDGSYGRRRETVGFTTAEARDAYGAQQRPYGDESWSDYETWEAPHSEWPTIRIVG